MASFTDDDFQKLSDLYSSLQELGLTEGEIYGRIFDEATLREILQAVNSIGETAWKYLREFPEDKHFMLNMEPMMQQIDAAYSEYPSADTHTGFTHSFLMRLVEKIAKEGIDAFANSKITYLRSNLPTIIEERQKRQQLLQGIAIAE